VPKTNQEGNPIKTLKSQLGVAVLEIIILIGVLAIAGAVYYVNAHSTIKNPPPVSISKKSTPPPPPPADPYVGWNTFSSSPYKFSFKYPIDTSVENMIDNGDVVGYTIKGTTLSFHDPNKVGGIGCTTSTSDTTQVNLGSKTITVKTTCGLYIIYAINSAGQDIQIWSDSKPYTDTAKKILESVVGLDQKAQDLRG